MKSIVGILKIGAMGNIRTIVKSLNKIKAKTIIIEKPEDFSRCDKIIIPGVGYFGESMSFLQSKNLLEILQNEISQKYTLGICLGMQLLSKLGYEGGENAGLGFIDGVVDRIHTNLPVPHLGFNTINILEETAILKGISERSFYFMHSYHFVCYTNITSITHYENTPIVASIQKENIFGTQFHPECSREVGLKIFENFIEL